MKKIIGLIVSLGLLLLAACSNGEGESSPNKILAKVMAEEGKLQYYGEMTITSDLDELDGVTMKEWRDGKKARIEISEGEEESISVNDGKSLLVYEKQANKLYDFTDDELLSIQFNPKEQLDLVLGSVKDTHKVDKVGNETIAGRDTVHVKAIPKEKGEIMGEQEFWVDTEHWVILKMTTKTEDFTMAMEYVEIDFQPSFEEDLFEMDVPEDAEIEVFDAQSLEEKIELEELPTILDETALYIPEKEGLTLEHANVFHIDEENKMIDLSYNKDGVAYVTVTIIDPVEDNIKEQLDILGKEAEAIEVRQQDGIYMDAGQLKMLAWNEGSYQYNVTPIDPNITMEDLLSLTDKMETME